MTTLLEAIQKKYESLGDVDHLQHVTLCGSPTAWLQKFRNASGQLLAPSTLILDSLQIASLGNLPALKSVCSRVLELDLTNNNICSWQIIIELLSNIRQLNWLNISENFNLQPTTMPHFLPNSFVRSECLNTLILNKLSLNWCIINKLLTMANQINELHVSGANGLTNWPEWINKAIMGFSSIKQFYCNSTGVGQRCIDWEKLTQLFPSLEKLTLIGNEINKITVDIIGQQFVNLKSLNLSENPITSWQCIDKLQQFQQLIDLRISDIDLIKSHTDTEFRQESIARLPKLILFNGTEVDGGEREEAERAFVRRYCNSNCESKPPRFAPLMEIHGHLEEFPEVNLTPPLTVNLSVSVNSLTAIESSNTPTKLTVGKLKSRLCRKLNLQESDYTLYFTLKSELAEERVEMTPLGRRLHSYKPVDGDEVALVANDDNRLAGF